MKAVMLSIQPKWCELIAKGEKHIELRKSIPNLEPPFRCYIYCTKGGPHLNSRNGRLYLEEKDVLGGRGYGIYRRLDGMVIGEFVCDTFLHHCEMANADIAEALAKVRREKILEYADGREVFGWHISEPRIYDKPKPLSSFNRPCPYKLPDGSRMDVPCPCDKYTWGFDEQAGLSYCMRRMKKPPQSWCYVEEASNVNP